MNLAVRFIAILPSVLIQVLNKPEITVSNRLNGRDVQTLSESMNEVSW